MQEIELKILLDEAQARHLRTAPTLADLTLDGPRTQTLVSIYYDTSDFALRKAGIALRLRRKGRAWVQTVKKALAPISGGLAQPLEDEIPVRGQNFALERIENDDLREEVIGLTRAGIAPVAETRFSRTSRLIRTHGGAEIELAIDKGEVSAGGASAPFLEAEFELKDGHPGDLFEMAADVFTMGPVRYSNHSKSARAAMLARRGYAIEPLVRQKSSPPTLSESMTAEQAARVVLGECLGQVLANIPVAVLTDDTSGPHQTRVGLRRLRSALNAFRPALGRAAMDPIAEQARMIAAQVGRIRDLDVLADDMVEPMARRHPEEKGFAALLKAIRDRQGPVREDVKTFLKSPDVTRFGFQTSGFLAGRGWLDPRDHDQTLRLARPVRKLARKQLDKRWNALSEYGNRIADLSIEQRHEMRKEIKKIRYVGEMFQSLFDVERVRTFRAGLRAMQDAFGALNDVAMAEVYLLSPDSPGADDPLAQRAAGRLLGAAQAESDLLWPKAISDWRALAKAGPFWR